MFALLLLNPHLGPDLHDTTTTNKVSKYGCFMLQHLCDACTKAQRRLDEWIILEWQVVVSGPTHLIIIIHWTAKMDKLATIALWYSIGKA